MRLGLKTHFNEVERTVQICNRLGMHARAAGKLRNLAAQFQSTIKLVKGRMEADAKSILGLMALEASRGTELIVRAWGDDSEQAAEALCQLIQDRFGEDE